MDTLQQAVIGASVLTIAVLLGIAWLCSSRRPKAKPQTASEERLERILRPVFHNKKNKEDIEKINRGRKRA